MCVLRSALANVGCSYSGACLETTWGLRQDRVQTVGYAGGLKRSNKFTQICYFQGVVHLWHPKSPQALNRHAKCHLCKIQEHPESAQAS